MLSLRSNLDLPSGGASSSALPLPAEDEGEDGQGVPSNGGDTEIEDISPECTRLLAEGKKRERAYNTKMKELNSLKDVLKDKKTVQQDCNIVVPLIISQSADFGRIPRPRFRV